MNRFYSSEEEAQAAIDGYVATLGITDDDTVYEKSSFIMQPQASMVIEDQKTGEVVAMIGGRGEKTANKTLNRVTNALRNPGSTFKIVAAYAPAFEELGYGPGHRTVRRTVCLHRERKSRTISQ